MLRITCRSATSRSLPTILPRARWLWLVAAALLVACATSPLDRRQVVLYSDQDMAQQGAAAYQQMRQQIPISNNPNQINYVQCVADYVVAALSDQQRSGVAWEVTVFDDEQANAFALPGGKIGVYNGLLDVAVNQHQLAAVMAHEVGHVIAAHSNERASQSTIRNAGLTAARILGASDVAIELIDQGAQLGIFLPFNRTQESEADVIGVMLMAEAGFDPAQSIQLWENMNAVGGARPPEFLSTHPAPESRIAELNSYLPAANALLDQARREGISPDCNYARN
jgi:predicted Zn-dependent protease